MEIEKITFVTIIESKGTNFLKKYFTGLSSLLLIGCLALTKIYMLSDRLTIIVFVLVSVFCIFLHFFLKFNSKIVVDIKGNYFLIQIDDIILDSRKEYIKYDYGKCDIMTNESIYLIIEGKKYYIPILFPINSRKKLFKLAVLMSEEQNKR